MDDNTVKRLCFTGTAEDYPAWSTKFTAFMQTKGLYKSLLGKEVIPQEIPPLAEDASEQQRAERETKVQQRNKKLKISKSGIIAFGVILRWRLTKQVGCIFDMIVYQKTAQETVRKAGVYFNSDIRT